MGTSETGGSHPFFFPAFYQHNYIARNNRPLILWGGKAVHFLILARPILEPWNAGGVDIWGDEMS